MRPAPRPLLAASIAASLAFGGACQTPCDALASHASACNTAPAAYAAPPTCPILRAEVAPARFDPFVRCVEAAPCTDANAVSRCAAPLLIADDPCLRLRLWAAGCGLEPAGLDNDCQGGSGSLSRDVLAQWVACVTRPGCPQVADERFRACGELFLPQPLTGLLDACYAVTTWTQTCGPLLPSEPILSNPNTYPTCLAASALFTLSSFEAFGRCISQISCDNGFGRAICLQGLQPVDVGAATPACEELLAFEAACGSSTGGASVQTCAAALGRATPESLQAYVDCMKAAPCGDPVAPVSCSQRLQPQ
jgi:hypothetical protein